MKSILGFAAAFRGGGAAEVPGHPQFNSEPGTRPKNAFSGILELILLFNAIAKRKTQKKTNIPRRESREAPRLAASSRNADRRESRCVDTAIRTKPLFNNCQENFNGICISQRTSSGRNKQQKSQQLCAPVDQAGRSLRRPRRRSSPFSPSFFPLFLLNVIFISLFLFPSFISSFKAPTPREKRPKITPCLPRGGVGGLHASQLLSRRSESEDFFCTFRTNFEL